MSLFALVNGEICVRVCVCKFAKIGTLLLVRYICIAKLNKNKIHNQLDLSCTLGW